MKYEERMRELIVWLSDPRDGVLSFYAPPDHITEASIQKNIQIIAEDVNNKLPEDVKPDYLRLLLRDTFRELRTIHGSRSWPSSKLFMQAAGSIAARALKAERETEGKTLGDTPTPEQINRDRIKAKQPVADRWIYGIGARRLVSMGYVEEQDLTGYKSSLFHSAKDVYGNDSALELEARWKERDRTASEEIASLEDVSTKTDGF